jgi:YHS domain-containing protein
MHFDRRLLLSIFAALLIGGCGNSGPFNLTADRHDNRVMLTGHDPVGYFVSGKHQPGNPAIKAEHEGVTYRFVDENNKAEFLRSPAKYAPQFGGYCSNGIAYGIPWGGDADTFRIIDGKLYIFGGKESLDYFLMDEKNNLERAHRLWKDEVAGSNAIVQRVKRLVFRVPHYKTGAQLAEEWKNRQQTAPSGK